MKIKIHQIGKIFLLLFTLAFCNVKKGVAQYAPAVGQPGTTAISKDSSIIVNWAKHCTISRGLQDITNSTLGVTTVGDSSSANGVADMNNVISLGDGGMATCTFQYPIINADGYDFAVFENSFENNFLELAFVEVSSDGTYFSRFPAISLTDTTEQVGSFDYLNPTKINNLAGKYIGGYGVPFDLQELINDTNINLNNITHVRVIDVVGNINNVFASHDSESRKINDPWPTPFASGGFDLDAIAVIHQDNSSGIAFNSNKKNNISVFPNPSSDYIQLNTLQPNNCKMKIYTLEGSLVKEFSNASNSYNISFLDKGIYILKIESGNEIENIKLVKN